MSDCMVATSFAQDDFGAETPASRKPVRKALTARGKMPEHVRNLIIDAAQQIRALPRSRRLERWGTGEVDKAVVVEMRRRRIAWFMGLSDVEAEEAVDDTGLGWGDNGHRAFHTLKGYMESGIAEARRLQREAHLEEEVA